MLSLFFKDTLFIFSTCLHIKMNLTSHNETHTQLIITEDFKIRNLFQYHYKYHTKYFFLLLLKKELNY